MRRFVINAIIALALGLGLTLGWLWLLGGGLPVIQAQASDGYVAGAGTFLPQNASSPSEPDVVTRERVNQALLNLPLRFIANAGQTDPAVHFTVKGAGHTIFFTEEEVVFSASSSEFRVPSSVSRNRLDPASETQYPIPNIQYPTPNSQLPTRNSSTVRLRFVGANPHPTVEGLSPMSGVANFFLGDDPAEWQVNVPTYEALAYRDLYPGVDLVYRGTEGRLKSEFLLAPGADPTAIQMVYSGVEDVRLREDGALVLETALGELIEEAPLIYQEADGLRQEIAGGYVLLSPGADLTGFPDLSGLETYRVGFQVGAYDPARPLVIDPALSYASYLGGGGSDYGRGIAVDSAGAVYITGETSSNNFPTHDAIQPGYGGGSDVFVTQIISVGEAYTYGYSTYLGGGNYDYGWDIAVPPGGAGGVYVTGWTNSSDFPTHNAIQVSLRGSRDAFVAQIISAGGVYTLAYSTYLGGSGGGDFGSGIAVSPGAVDEAYVTGVTDSADFPTHNAIQATLGGGSDAFVTRIISAGGVYTYGYATYLGGSGVDSGEGIAVDEDGNAYVTGITWSDDDFPITPNAVQPGYGGGSRDAFVTQIISTAGVYTYGYSTYLGGGSDDYGWDIAVPPGGAGEAYVIGWTYSTDFPTTTNAIQPGYGGGSTDAFVTRIISATGVYTYGYSTYLGGGGSDYGRGIAVSGAGDVYVGGDTSSNDFPTHNAVQANQGDYDAFVTQVISAGGVYTYGYSTYLGGDGEDRGHGIALGGEGDAYITGKTASNNFPLRDAIQMAYGGGDYDAFVARISKFADLAISKEGTPGIVTPGGAITYTLAYTNQGGGAVIGVLITDVVPMTLTNVGFTSGGAQITPTGGVSYTWQVAPLAPGAGGIITLTGVVSPPVGGVFSLTNWATITTTDGYYVEESLDNNASVVYNTVDAEPPIAPALVSPANGAVISDTTPTLTWRASPDAAGYLLDWNGAVVDVGAVTQCTPTALTDGIYTWTVAAYDLLRNTSPYTDVWSFTVSLPGPVEYPTYLPVVSRQSP